MQLNTTSGLTGALDAIGQAYQANQRNDAQTRALVSAGILPASDMPQGGILSQLLGGGQAAPRGPSTPAPASPMPAATNEPSTPSTQQSGLPTFAAASGQGALSPNASTALAYFADKGLSPIASQGLVGGFTRESGAGLDPHAVNPNGGATGIAQWLGSRKNGLMDFAASGGRDPNDLRTQLDYVWSELQGPEKATLAALQKAQNPLAATAAALGFERPEGWTSGNPMGAKDFDKRLAATVRLGGGNPTFGRTDTTPTGSTPGASGGGAPADGGESPTARAIKALVREPTMRDYGMKLWEQSVTGRNYGFQVLPDGTVLRTDPRTGEASPVYQGKAKPMVVGSSLIDPSHPDKPIYTDSKGEYSVQQIGENEFGGKQFGVVDKSKGTATPLAPPAGTDTTQSADPNSNLHGADYLATLHPQIAGMVKAVDEGRQDLPTGMGGNAPFARKLRAAVLQYNPDFDAATAKARLKTQTAFKPGGSSTSPGMQVLAGQTAIGHLGELSEAAAALNNYNTGVPGNDWLNSARNLYQRSSGTGSNVNQFQLIRDKAIEELTRFYRGSGGTEADLKRDIDNISAASSPTELAGSIYSLANLAMSKTQGLQQTWHAGMDVAGKPATDFPIMTDANKKTLNAIAQRAGKAAFFPEVQAEQEPAKPAATPSAAAPVQGAKQAKDGHWYLPDPARPGKYLQVQ